MTKYEEIQNDIIDKIERGVYKTNDKIPSESELIKQWQVSRITVIKALTELSLGGYIYRVQGRGSFVCPLGSHIQPSAVRSAQNKKTNRRVKRIGVSLPGHSDTHGGKLLNGILKSLHFPEYYVNTVISKSKEAEDYALTQFLENGYDGIILFPVDFEFYSDVILKISLAKFPLVLADRRFPAIGCLSVTGDNARGTELAAEHLYRASHRGIAFICALDYREQVSHMRYEAYRESMQKRGLRVISFERFADNTKEFVNLVKQGDITATITCNVSALNKLCEVCIKEGIDIPNDLSVVTFDDPNAAGIPHSDFFTFIDQKPFDMGQQAAEMLKNMINGVYTESKITQPHLVTNKSTKKLT